MRFLTLITLAVGVSAQTGAPGGPSVVLPSNGRHSVYSPKDVRDLTNDVDRQDYRNKFAYINPFSNVDFNVTPMRPNGQALLATRENTMTEESSVHTYTLPNQDCPMMCSFEDRQIAEL